MHDKHDGLTVNWANDYPGGLKLNGVHLITKDPQFISVTISGGLNVTEGSLYVSGDLGLTGQRIDLTSKPENPAGMQIHGNVQFRDAVFLNDKTTVGKFVEGPTGPLPMIFNVFEELLNLRKEVAELKKKVGSA